MDDEEDSLAYDRAGEFSHLDLCVDADGSVQFYPSGDADALAKALRTIVRLFNENPFAIDCAAGACVAGDCAGHAHGPVQ